MARPLDYCHRCRACAAHCRADHCSLFAARTRLGVSKFVASNCSNQLDRGIHCWVRSRHTRRNRATGTTGAQGRNGRSWLNRLLKKHSTRRFGEGSLPPPALEPENIGSNLEEWNTADIAALWRGHDRERPGAVIAAQFAIYLPIVVLRLGDDHWLMDGNNRVNKRLREANLEPHPVYLWEVASTDKSKQR